MTRSSNQFPSFVLGSPDFIHQILLRNAISHIWTEEPFGSLYCEGVHWHALDIYLSLCPERKDELIDYLQGEHLLQTHFWAFLNLTDEMLDLFQQWHTQKQDQSEHILEEKSAILSNCNMEILLTCEDVKDKHLGNICDQYFKNWIEKQHLDQQTVKSTKTDEALSRL